MIEFTTYLLLIVAVLLQAKKIQELKEENKHLKQINKYHGSQMYGRFGDEI